MITAFPPVVQVSSANEGDVHGDVHRLKGARGADERSRNRYELGDVARDRHGDQVSAAHAPICRVEGDPSRTRKENFNPCMGRASRRRTDEGVRRVVEISGHDPRPEAKNPDTFGKERRKILTAPAPQ